MQQHRSFFSGMSVCALTRTAGVTVAVLACLFVLGATVSGKDWSHFFSGDEQQHEDDPQGLRLALLRPFSPGDADDLINSFEDWSKQFPCDTRNQDSRTSYLADLFLSISQNLANYPGIEGKINDAIRSANGDWASCFSSVRIIEAQISADEDEYSDSSYYGPNLQFVRSLGHIRDKKEYDAVFLMEADTTPWTNNWLDKIAEEIVELKPFSVLGSRPHGVLWEQKEATGNLPPALSCHFNGNAVYNITDAFFGLVLDEIEEEIVESSILRVIPYDQRIAEIFLDASGVGDSSLPIEKRQKATSHIPLIEISEEKISKSKDLWRNLFQGTSFESVYVESSVIESFQGSNFLPQEVSMNAAVVHGKLLRDSWSASQSISLVLREGSYSDTQAFLTKLDSTSHPFESVVLIRRLPQTAHSYTSNTQIQVSVGESICRIFPTIASKWFVTAHASDVVNDDIQFPTSRYAQKPITPFLQAAHQSTCWKDHDCRFTIKEAKLIYQHMDKVFLDGEVVFDTALHSSFCDFIERSRAEKNFEESTTNYFAYLFSQAIAENTYIFSDRTRHGYYVNFINWEATAIENGPADNNAELQTSANAKNVAQSKRERALEYAKSSKEKTPQSSKRRASVLAAVAARQAKERASEYAKSSKEKTSPKSSKRRARVLAAVAVREAKERASEYAKSSKEKTSPKSSKRRARARVLAAVAVREAKERASEYAKSSKEKTSPKSSKRRARARVLAAVAVREAKERASEYAKSSKEKTSPKSSKRRARVLAAVAVREAKERASEYAKSSKEKTSPKSSKRRARVL